MATQVAAAYAGRVKAPWKLVFRHHPIYSASPYHGDTLELRDRLLPILQAHDAQHTSAGMITIFNSTPAPSLS